MPHVNPSEERPHAFACGLLIAVLLMATYWPALDGAYLWDDDTRYTANVVRIHELLAVSFQERGETERAAQHRERAAALASTRRGTP